jgi:hypothetical protein
LARNRTLKHLWHEFRESFVYPRARPGEGAWIRNSIEPSAHFNTPAVIEPHVSVRAFGAVPNYLTGLGILGTFIGLSAGIYLAQIQLGQLAETQNLQLMQQGLQQLLAGASLAFLTSIFGLFASMGFLLFERTAFGRVNRTVRMWNDALDVRLELVTPEKLAADELFELREQTEQLKLFNTELAVSIGTALEEKVAGQLLPKFDELIGAVQEVKAERQSANEEFLQTLVDGFQQKMTGAAGQEMEALSDTLASLNRGLLGSTELMAQRTAAMEDSLASIKDEIEGSLQRSSSALQRALEESLGKVSGEVSNLTQLVGQSLEESGARAADVVGQAVDRLASETTGRVTSMLQRLERASSEMSDRLEVVGKQVEERSKQSMEAATAQAAEGRRVVESIGLAQDKMTDLVEELSGMQQGFHRLLPGLRSSAEGFQAAASETRASVSAIEAASVTARNAAASIDSSQTALAEAWNAYQERFEGIDVALQRVFDQIDGGLERYTTRVSEFNDEFDAHMSQAVKSLGGVVSEMSDTLEDLRGVMGSSR